MKISKSASSYHVVIKKQTVKLNRTNRTITLIIIRFDKETTQCFIVSFSDILDVNKLTCIDDDNKRNYTKEVLNSFDKTSKTMATIDLLEGVNSDWYINNIKNFEPPSKTKTTLAFVI